MTSTCISHSNARYSAHGGIVSEIGEQHRPFDGARLFEIVHEILRFLEGDADRRKHDGKFGIPAFDLRLPRDLRGEFGVRQTAHRKHGQFLPSYQRIESVDGRDARLDKFIGIVARGGIDRLSVDVHLLFGNDGRAAVAGIAHAVEHPPEHIFGHGKLLTVP